MVRVTAAVIERDGRILIARRRKLDRMGGKWEFPGGKLSADETPEECLKRELKEELDIVAEVGAFICSCKFSYFLVPLELLVYKARIVSGEVKALDHDEIAWVEPRDLGRYDLVKADIEVMEKLKKDVYHVA